MGISSNEVMNFMTENGGKHFTVSQIARHFNTFPRAVQKIVENLAEAEMVSCHTRGAVMTFMASKDRQLQMEVRREIQTSFKPLNAEYTKRTSEIVRQSKERWLK